MYRADYTEEYPCQRNRFSPKYCYIKTIFVAPLSQDWCRRIFKTSRGCEKLSTIRSSVIYIQYMFRGLPALSLSGICFDIEPHISAIPFASLSKRHFLKKKATCSSNCSQPRIRHYLAGTFRRRHFHRILIMTIAHNRIQSENDIIYILFHHDLHFTVYPARCTSINFTQTYTVGNKVLPSAFTYPIRFVTSNRIIRHFRIYQQSIGIIPVNSRTIFLSFGYDMEVS